MNAHELLPRSEAASLLGISHDSLEFLTRKGHGPLCYSGARGRGVQARYRRADVEAYATARANGRSVRDASIWAAREALKLTLTTIEQRYGDSDPAFAATQRNVASLFLTKHLARMGVSVHALDAECRRIEAALAGLPT